MPIQVPSWVPGWFVSGGSANLPHCWNKFSPTRSKGCPFRFQVGFQVGLFRAALQTYHTVEINFHLPGPRGAYSVPSWVPDWFVCGRMRSAILLLLFPFLFHEFFTVPYPLYPSFCSMSFTLIYICCNFRGLHSICCFPHCSHMFLTCRELLSLIRSYPLPFPCRFVCIMFLSLPFLLCICSLIYICGSFRGGILSAVFPTVVTSLWPAGEPGVPFPFPLFLSCSCPSLFFYVLINWSIRAVVSVGILSVVFPHYSHIFCRRMRNALFLLLSPFLLLFFYIVPYPSFSSMSCSLTYICCSFRGGILSVVSPL